MISFSLSGSTAKTNAFLKAMQSADMYTALDRLAQRGVTALQANTPTDTGLTASSWSYEVEITKEAARIWWLNAHNVSGVNVAILLQYGHGTGTGGYVAGRDYINTAMQPIFDEIANDVWKKVTNA